MSAASEPNPRDGTSSSTSSAQCESLFALLPGYVDAVTSPSEEVEIERHLADCPDCQAYVEFLRAESDSIGQVLKALPEMQPPVELFTRIAEATYRRPTLRDRIQALLRPVPVRVALGSAFALGLTAYVAVRLNYGPSAPANPTIAQNTQNTTPKVPSEQPTVPAPPPSVTPPVSGGARKSPAPLVAVANVAPRPNTAPAKRVATGLSVTATNRTIAQGQLTPRRKTNPTQAIAVVASSVNKGEDLRKHEADVVHAIDTIDKHSAPPRRIAINMPRRSMLQLASRGKIPNLATLETSHLNSPSGMVEANNARLAPTNEPRVAATVTTPVLEVGVSTASVGAPAPKPFSVNLKGATDRPDTHSFIQAKRPDGLGTLAPNTFAVVSAPVH